MLGPESWEFTVLIQRFFIELFQLVVDCSETWPVFWWAAPTLGNQVISAKTSQEQSHIYRSKIENKSNQEKENRSCWHTKQKTCSYQELQDRKPVLYTERKRETSPIDKKTSQEPSHIYSTEKKTGNKSYTQKEIKKDVKSKAKKHEKKKSYQH